LRRMSFIKNKIRYALLLALLLPALPSQTNAEMRDLPFITVYAASSLTLPMTEIIRNYSASHDLTINATYESSSELESRIEEGSSTDIFIAAHPEWVEKLVKLGMVNGKAITLLRNKLALIAATDSPLMKELPATLQLPQLLTIIGNRAIMVIGDPGNTPLGKYTRESLQQLGLWRKFEPLVIHAANARIALHLIAQGKTVGITYASDTTANPDVKILSLLPSSPHNPILYQAAITSEENIDYSRNFLAYLSSADAMKIFARYGFEAYRPQ
jgi:molybdate transport system substrate-binding protein